MIEYMLKNEINNIYVGPFLENFKNYFCMEFKLVKI